MILWTVIIVLGARRLFRERKIKKQGVERRKSIPKVRNQ
jgi:hypothetical protein